MFGSVFGRICMLSFGFGAVTSVHFWFRPKLKKTVSVDLYEYSYYRICVVSEMFVDVETVAM